ncbi:phosphohydrolase [Acetobacter sp.]|uniref:phosphohydrolase n=1 Tax=Acetobacter sp. TaxID=440 RepID=UPI0039E9AFE7
MQKTEISTTPRPNTFSVPSNVEGWKSISLSPDLRVIVHEERPIWSAATEAQVEAIWSQAKQARPRLFNGRIFCADRIEPDCIMGHWTEYRLALAQMTDPLIFGDRPLQQLAVCGLLHCPEGVVLARRNPSSIYLGGCWQSPPAGTVESRTETGVVSLSDQILAEAKEELGLDKTELIVGNPRIAMIHGRTRIVDIGIPLTTSLPFTALERRWRDNANTEYDLITCIPMTESHQWRLRKDILPTTQTLLQQL